MINESSEQSICESDRLEPAYDAYHNLLCFNLSVYRAHLLHGSRYACFAIVLLFASLGVQADALSRPASGIDAATTQDEFLFQALHTHNSGSTIEALQASQTTFLARVDLPPSPKKLGLIILVDSDAELLSRNLANALHFELGLMGWPVLIVSTEALRAVSPEDQLDAGQAILRASIDKLGEQGVGQVTLLLSSFAEPVTESIAQGRLDAVSGVVSLNRQRIDIDKLPDLEALRQLNVAGVKLLDLAPHSANRQNIALRKQTLQRAGFSDNYDLLFKPEVSGDAQYKLIAKRLRAWMTRLNS